jgi:hypothetical protein
MYVSLPKARDKNAWRSPTTKAGLLWYIKLFLEIQKGFYLKAT